MKSTTSKPAVAQPKRNAPFFSKDNGQGFFVQSRNKSSFFSPVKAGSCIQPKLTVGKPNDKYEKEADAVADKVVQRMAISDKAIPGQGVVQQKPVAHAITPVVHRKCAECEREEKLQKKEEENTEEMPLQRKPIFESNADPEDDKPLQRKCEACGHEEEKAQRKEGQSTQPSASSSIESQLNSSKGAGSPLAHDVNASMSNAFGTDLSQVRVHADSKAAEMSKALNAQAFTHGQDIYFNSGKYDPESAAGKHLLAHELTHTVQQGGNSVRKKPGGKKDKKEEKEIIPAKTANPEDLKKAGLTKGKHQGYITRNGQTLEINLIELFTKRYLKEEDASFLDLPARLPKPSDERKTRQIQEWKKEVKDKVEAQLLANYSKKKDTESEDLSLTLLTRKQTGAIGTLKQLAGEAAIPFWSQSGKPKVFDVEHMVDWQISFRKADDIRNLMLLDRSENRSLGNEVRKNIHDHIQTILDHYRKTYSQIPLTAETSLASCKVQVEKFRFEGKGLNKEIRYKLAELLETGAQKSAFTKEKILVKDAKIPEGMFLLKTSNSRAGYLIPYNKTQTIGAWTITSEFDKKTKELISLSFGIGVKDDKGVFEREIKAKGKDVKKLTMPFEKEKNLIYKISPIDLKQQYGIAFKEMYGEIKHASPIQFDEPVVDGLDVSITGKVVPTLSFLKDVDIRFGAENGEFYIQAEIPLNKLAANFPKPFEVNSCSLIIAASSDQGLTVLGDIDFKLSKFGEGTATAGVNSREGVFLEGTFNFNNKWFDPAQIKFGYRKGKWNVGGKIGIPEGLIKGIKKGDITIAYSGRVVHSIRNGRAKRTRRRKNLVGG